MKNSKEKPAIYRHSKEFAFINKGVLILRHFITNSLDHISMTKKDKVYMIKYVRDVLHKKSRILQVYRIIDSNKDNIVTRNINRL